MQRKRTQHGVGYRGLHQRVSTGHGRHGSEVQLADTAQHGRNCSRRRPGLVRQGCDVDHNQRLHQGRALQRECHGHFATLFVNQIEVWQ